MPSAHRCPPQKTMKNKIKKHAIIHTRWCCVISLPQPSPVAPTASTPPVCPLAPPPAPTWQHPLSVTPLPVWRGASVPRASSWARGSVCRTHSAAAPSSTDITLWEALRSYNHCVTMSWCDLIPTLFPPSCSWGRGLWRRTALRPVNAPAQAPCARPRPARAGTSAPSSTSNGTASEVRVCAYNYLSFTQYHFSVKSPDSAHVLPRCDSSHIREKT